MQQKGECESPKDCSRSLLAETESSRKLLANEWLDTAITYKVEWEKELDRRSRPGITDLPEPLPHPDHVVIDFNEGTARIVGPATKEERAELEEWYARRDDFQAELDELEEMRAETDDEAELALIDDDIATTRRVLENYRWETAQKSSMTVKSVVDEFKCEFVIRQTSAVPLVQNEPAARQTRQEQNRTEPTSATPMTRRGAGVHIALYEPSKSFAPMGALDPNSIRSSSFFSKKLFGYWQRVCRIPG